MTCTTKRYYTLAGISVAVRDSAGSGSLNYLLGDQLGSTTVSVNSAGGTPVVQRYLPYGAPRSTTGGSAVTDRGWIGQTKDNSTGLQYLNARYYDPVIGRFTATDPLADLNSPGTLDAYGYAGGSPVSAKDPSGLFGLPVYEEMQNIANRGYQIHLAYKREGRYDRPEPRGFFAGLLNGFVALPIAALGVATDATNCARGAGCGFEHSRNMQHGVAHTITNPTSIYRTCMDDRAGCAGGLVGGFGAGAAMRRLLGRGGALLDDAAPTWQSLLDEGAAKVPRSWGPGIDNRNSVGTRWTDPSSQGNGVRIDKADPLSGWPSQQVDHVVVRSGGEILGPEGKAIVGSLKENPQAHIPLADWLDWDEWNHPG